MALFSLSKKILGEAVLAIDIGSNSVGGALVYFAVNKKPKILYETREFILCQENINRENLFNSALRSLNKLLERIQKEGVLHLNFTGLRQKAIMKVSCTLSAPWHVSAAKNIKVSFTKPAEITFDFLEDVIEKERKDFLENISESNVLSKGKPDYEFIEARALKISLNGYETKKPEGKKASDFEAALFFSLSPSVVVNSLRKTIFRYFHATDVDFHSFSFVSFTAARDFFSADSDFLSISVGGEITEISLVRENVLSETLSFPLGYNAIIRKIMEKMGNISSGVALSFLKLHGSGDENPSLYSKIEKIITQLEDDWVNLLYGSIHKLSQELYLPKSVFVFAEEGSADMFSSFMKRQKLRKENAQENTFSVIAIDEGMLKFFCETNDISEKDSFLAVESIFLGRILEKQL